MKKQLNQLIEFHKTFNIPMRKEPGKIGMSRQILRYNLIREENAELQEAMNAGNKYEVSKEMADLLYVVYGTVIELGLQDIITEVFDEVHRSNMSKVCDSDDAYLQTIAHYQNEGVETSGISLGNRRHVVLRSPDGKVLKPVNYSPANVKKCF